MTIPAFQHSAFQGFQSSSKKTLLDAVNEILKRVNVIAGNTGLLNSLVSSSLQHNIDIAVQVVNEGLDELYQASNKSLPNEQAESRIALATGVREYTLASDLIVMIWPMIDRVNTQYIREYKEGYNAMLLLDPQQIFTGTPYYGCISPINGNLRLDRAPDATVNGNTYTYEYERDLVLESAKDVMPFLDATFRAMVPAWVQLYKREMRNEFDQSLYAQSMGRASRLVTEEKPRTHYSPRG